MDNDDAANHEQVSYQRTSSPFVLQVITAPHDQLALVQDDFTNFMKSFRESSEVLSVMFTQMIIKLTGYSVTQKNMDYCSLTGSKY